MSKTTNPKAKKKQKATGSFSNDTSLGDKELLQKVCKDMAVLKVTEEDAQAANRMSKVFTQELFRNRIDSCNQGKLKFGKYLRGIKLPGFKAKTFDLEKAEELRPLKEWCSQKGVRMKPFIKVYLGKERKKGMEQTGFEFHRDKFNKLHNDGVESDQRIMLTRIAESCAGEVEKTFSFREYDESCFEYNDFSIWMEDCDVVVLGPKAAGKESKIQHAVHVFERNSISIMVDLTFPDGSEFHNYTTPEFAQYLVEQGVFERKTNINVRYGPPPGSRRKSK